MTRPPLPNRTASVAWLLLALFCLTVWGFAGYGLSVLLGEPFPCTR